MGQNYFSETFPQQDRGSKRACFFDEPGTECIKAAGCLPGEESQRIACFILISNPFQIKCQINHAFRTWGESRSSRSLSVRENALA